MNCHFDGCSERAKRFPVIGNVHNCGDSLCEANDQIQWARGGFGFCLTHRMQLGTSEMFFNYKKKDHKFTEYEKYKAGYEGAAQLFPMLGTCPSWENLILDWTTDPSFIPASAR